MHKLTTKFVNSGNFGVLQCVQSILSSWDLYINRSYDLEMLRCELQNILLRDEIALSLKKEETTQLKMVLCHHSYTNLLLTIRCLVAHSDSNSFEAQKALELCLKQLEQFHNLNILSEPLKSHS